MMKRLKVAISSIFLSLLFATTLACARPVEVRILYINDFHGFAQPYAPFGSKELLGGLPYLAAKANSLRKQKPSLFLSAGDMIQGNNWANLVQGESVIEWMNEMRFDAMVLGNHEFDFGQEVLRKRISESSFPVLGANVVGLNHLIKPFVIEDLAGVKIGIIGVVAEETPTTTHPRNVAGLKFISPVETVRKYVGELKPQVDLVVLLSHIGYPADRDLAQRVKGIDVIVGGHSHTKIAKPVRLGNTLIVQSWEHEKALGVLDLTLEDGKVIGYEGRLEEIKPEKGKEDQATLAIVKKYQERVGSVLDERIGVAEVDLDGENVRKKETNLGDLVADIMRRVSRADVTLINGGGIRTSIRKGEVRVKDVYAALPFDSYIVSIRLTGRQVRKALEHGVSAVENGEGRFPQVSGMTFKYSQSEKQGSRIKEVFVEGAPIRLDQEYLVATNDFLAAGGDGYRAFGEAIRSSKDFSTLGGVMKGEKIVYSDPGRWLRDVVVESIKEVKRIAPKTEERIIEVRP